MLRPGLDGGRYQKVLCNASISYPRMPLCKMSILSQVGFVKNDDAAFSSMVEYGCGVRQAVTNCCNTLNEAELNLLHKFCYARMESEF